MRTYWIIRNDKRFLTIGVTHNTIFNHYPYCKAAIGPYWSYHEVTTVLNKWDTV